MSQRVLKICYGISGLYNRVPRLKMKFVPTLQLYSKHSKTFWWSKMINIKLGYNNHSKNLEFMEDIYISIFLTYFPEKVL